MFGFLNQLLDHDQLLPLVAIVGGLSVAIIWILSATWHAIVTARGREATRREIAAYVAEGTMDPRVAIALLQDENTEAKTVAEMLAAADVTVNKAIS